MQGKQGQEGDLVKFSISRVWTTVPWGRGRAGHKGSAVPAASLQKARWLCMAHARGSVDRRSVRGHGRAGPLQVLVAAVGRVGKSDRPSGGGAGATG